MNEPHLGDERVRLVVEPPLPPGIVDPCQVPVHPHPKSEWIAQSVVRLSYVGIKELAKLI